MKYLITESRLIDIIQEYINDYIGNDVLSGEIDDEAPDLGLFFYSNKGGPFFNYVKYDDGDKRLYVDGKLWDSVGTFFLTDYVNNMEDRNFLREMFRQFFVNNTKFKLDEHVIVLKDPSTRLALD